MRSFTLALVVLALVPGCWGPTNNALEGPSTTGDANRTTWQIADGLCGHGLFGNQCDLGQVVAVGASPSITVRGLHGQDLAHATLSGGEGVVVSAVDANSDDHGTTLSATVSASGPGTVDVIVLDASGHEIDRAHLSFATPTTLTCGALGTGVVRDLGFSGLSTATVDVIAMPSDAGAAVPTGEATLACRTTDETGRILLSVDAIRWVADPSSEGTIAVASDDFLGSTPARGATARVRTTGTGHSTVHATLGASSAFADVDVTFH